MPKKKEREKLKSKSDKFIFSRRLIFLYAGIFLIFLISLLSVFDFFVLPKKNYSNTTSPSPVFFQKRNTATSYPSPTPLEGFTEINNYKLRQFDLDKPFLDFSDSKVDYPTELTNISESDLTPLSCTHSYFWNIPEPHEYTLVQDDGKEFLLTDPKLVSYVNALNKQYTPKHVMLINSCFKQDGKTFVFYGISQGGGGDYWGKPYLKVDSHSEAADVIENIGIGGCTALQLVKDSFLYIKCSEHEGGGGIDIISQVNLRNKSVTQILSCTNEGSKISCK